MPKVPIVRLNQVTDERWGELTEVPWMTEEEIVKNQVTLEEVLADGVPCDPDAGSHVGKNA